MCCHAPVSVQLISAFVLLMQISGCGKTDNQLPPSPRPAEDAESPAEKQAFKITLKSNEENVAVFDLSIDRDAAVLKSGDQTQHFDLKNQRWQHEGSKKWVTLSQCQNWARQSRAKSRASKSAVPPQIRRFVHWSLDPTFNIAFADGVLALTSGQVDYKIVVKKSDRDVTNYYRYARLNAYKKAMTERKLPPFAELWVLEELERRRLMPRKMEVQIPGIAAAPSFEIIISPQNE